MNERQIGSVKIDLAGRQSVLFGITRDERNASSELYCRAADASNQVPVSSGFTEVSYAHYLVGLALVDLAKLNLGSRVIINGTHPIDLAIGELVGLAPALSAIPVRVDQEDESVDAYIGCDISGLVRSLPYLRRGGVVVATCPFDHDVRLDLYGSLHRKGLTFQSLNLRRDLVAKLPTLASRFERLLVSKSNFPGKPNVGHGSE